MYIKRLINIIIEVLHENSQTEDEKEFLRDIIFAVTGLPNFSANFSAHIGFSFVQGKLLKNTNHRFYYFWMSGEKISLSYSQYKWPKWEEPYEIVWFQCDLKKRIDREIMNKWFDGVEYCLKKREHDVHVSSSTILIKGRQIDMELP